MDKVRVDFIPGSAFLMICWIAADNQVKSIWQIYQSVHNVDKKAIFIGLFLSYILGFTLHALGNFLFDEYQDKIRKKSNATATQLSKSETWALIRENGEKHISILERWYALRALSQNLSAASLLSVSICLYKWFVFGYFEWSFVALGFIFFFIIFMEKSFVFDRWLNNDIDATLKVLNKP
jgi:hypothetical protein